MNLVRLYLDSGVFLEVSQKVPKHTNVELRVLTYVMHRLVAQLLARRRPRR